MTGQTDDECERIRYLTWACDKLMDVACEEEGRRLQAVTSARLLCGSLVLMVGLAAHTMNRAQSTSTVPIWVLATTFVGAVSCFALTLVTMKVRKFPSMPPKQFLAGDPNTRSVGRLVVLIEQLEVVVERNRKAGDRIAGWLLRVQISWFVTSVLALLYICASHYFRN